MILQPSNVELTKIHYYEKNLAGEKIPTISQEVDEKSPDRNVIIKKNIFGHKWVLKVNEEDGNFKKASKLRLVLYVFVFFSITVAVGFGIFLSLSNTIFKNTEHYVKDYVYPEDAVIRNRPQIELVTSTTSNKILDATDDDFDKYTTERKPYCNFCSSVEVCMKINDTSKPECILALDVEDPTGCGGLCQINTEYCHMLSQKYFVYQCLPRKNILTCADNEFNCQNMCIDIYKRCDGTIDCSNSSDEQNCDCDLSKKFHCGDNTSCLDLNLKCNKIIDCWDGSDEQNCYYANNCSPYQFRCNDGECVNQSDVCDGEFDCTDQSDELLGCLDGK